MTFRPPAKYSSPPLYVQSPDLDGTTSAPFPRRPVQSSISLTYSSYRLLAHPPFQTVPPSSPALTRKATPPRPPGRVVSNALPAYAAYWLPAQHPASALSLPITSVPSNNASAPSAHFDCVKHVSNGCNVKAVCTSPRPNFDSASPARPLATKNLLAAKPYGLPAHPPSPVPSPRSPERT